MNKLVLHFWSVAKTLAFVSLTIPVFAQNLAAIEKYDEKKKIISVPVIAENGAVTELFTRYRFNDKYFEVLVKKQPPYGTSK